LRDSAEFDQPSLAGRYAVVGRFAWKPAGLSLALALLLWSLISVFTDTR
jgi:hypothetical protein